MLDLSGKTISLIKIVLIVYSLKKYDIYASAYAVENNEPKSIKTIENDSVHYILFTRLNSDRPYYMVIGESGSAYNSSFDPAIPTKIIIHGYQSSCREPIFTATKYAYLTTGNYNIFCIDWAKIAIRPYLEAIDLSMEIGWRVARFIDWLVVLSGMDLEEVHLIGHSLGAQIAGIAGSNVQTGIVSRITGLDPAVPFIHFLPERSLDISDANVVELIFTSILSEGHPLGHINYFVNGGLEQPQCKAINRGTFLTRFSRELFPLPEIMCSHSEAHRIFVRAILHPFLFPAMRCFDVVSALNENCYYSDDKEVFYMFNLNHMANGIFSVTSST